MNKKQFFASSNSMTGFCSYFDKIYDPVSLKRIYIIKGGPGTGKSSTIRAVGEYFEESCNCDYFLCSSDPDSFDGLIINDSVAVIDGTSPHSVDAKYPAAVEKIIDNGRGLNDNIKKHREEIIDLCETKTKHYRTAYAYLKAAGELKREQLKKVSEKIDNAKLESAIDRFFKQNPIKGIGMSKIRLIQAITSKGIVRTKSFEDNSKTVAILTNVNGFENVLMQKFSEKAQRLGAAISTAYDPLLPYSTSGLNFPRELCITVYDKEIHGEIDYDKYKVFNCERFISRYDLNELRSLIRFTNKCNQILLDEAVNSFSNAYVTHKKLEDIYIGYNDFSAVDENTDIIINDIKQYI